MIKSIENTTNTKLAYSIQELAEKTSMSSAYYRAEIRAERLRAKKFGARVLILASDWQSYAESKSDWKPTNSNGENN